MQNIITRYEIKKLEDISKIRTYVEANKLEAPNFSELGRQLGADRRTINKYLSIKEIDNKLYVYDNRNVVSIHPISKFNTTNYLESHSIQLHSETFKNKKSIQLQALENLKELEKFNEQISKATREFRQIET